MAASKSSPKFMLPRMLLTRETNPGAFMRLFPHPGKAIFRNPDFGQGCLKLGSTHAGAGMEAIFAFINQIGMGRVIKWMPRQRLKWFSSIQSREVAARLGRPLVQACFNGSSFCHYS